MPQIRLACSLAALVIGCMGVRILSLPPQRTAVKQHLERARALESTNNPGAETEYRLAIELGGESYPRVLREYSWFLRRHLRFSEASENLAVYLRQTRGKDADDLKELKDLQRAGYLQKRISSSERPGLADLVEFASLVSFYGANQFRDAQPYAQRAVDLYPSSSQAYVALAMSMIGGESARRIELLHKAIDLDATNGYAHYWLALEYKAQSPSEEAALEFQKALELSKGEIAEAWRDLGEILTMQRKYEEAVEAFGNYLKSGKGSSRNQKRVEQKIKELKKSTAH